MDDADDLPGRSGTAASASGRQAASHGLSSSGDSSRVRRAAGAIFVALVAYTIATVITVATGQATIAVPLFLTVIALLLCGGSLRAGVSIGIVANVFIAVNAAVLFGMLLATGGASVGFLIAMPMVPAFAMLVGERRHVMFWSGTTIAAIVLVFVLNLFEFAFPIRPDQDRVAIAKFLVAIVVVAVIGGVTRLFIDDRLRAERALLEFRGELERRVEARTSELRESEEQVRLLLESTAEAIYGIDLNGDCTFVNPACVRMLGYRDQSELLGKNMYVLIHQTRADGTEYPIDECRIYQAFREGTGSHVDDEVLWRADGSSFPAEYWSYPMYKNGEVIGSVVTFLDISARRQAEASVRREEARLSSILDLAMNAVVCIDEDQRVRIFNRTAEEVFGYRADEVLGERVEMLLPESLRRAHEKHVEDFARLKQPRRMGVSRSEVMGRRKDGSTFPAAASISMIEVNGEKIFTATLDDLTEKHRIDKKLQQARKMEAVGQLTSGIAHDFNNVLAIVMGNLELAEEAAEKDRDVQEYLSAAMQGAQRGADLNRQLLTFSRQDVLEEKATNVGDIIRGMSGLLKRSLREDIEIETTFGAQECISKLDPAQLESAILNLAINARDAMPQGGKLSVNTAVGLPGKIVNGADSAEEMVCISVIDDGTGMTEGVQGRALEPFFTTKAVGAGSGLGLSMVHGFVTQAGGEMEINSEAGKGTAIHMMFPMAAAVEHVSDISACSELPRVADGEVILVVEDQREVRDVIVTYLNDLGYQVLEAEDGNSGIGILESSGSIDLIVSDLVLPGGMRGEDVVAQAKRIQPDVKALYISGNPLRSVASFDSGEMQTPLLRKPFSKADLALAVRECLDDT